MWIMTNIRREISFPSDNGFLRRQCPFRRRGFEVAVLTEEVQSFTQEAADGFPLEATDTKHRTPSEDDQPEAGFFCPYCGQQAPAGKWWTQDQSAYFRAIAYNIAVDVIN